MFETNTVFAGRFLLKELLGRGGSSEVWISEDIVSGNTPEVVKIFAPETGLSEGTLKLFAKDFEQISYLSHPGLMPVTYTDATQPTPYLVMPYLAEGSAQRLMELEGPLPEQEIALILKQIGSALRYLHAQNPPLMHQNLDPEKILLTKEGNYVLADYGIGRATRKALHKATGRVSGLPFAAPERFHDKPVYSEAGDIFSLGVILYTLCTGQVPWEGTGGLSLLQGAAVPDLPPQYSRVLNYLIKSCMSLNPQKRPTAKQLESEGKYYLANKMWRPTAGIYDMIEQQPKKEGIPFWLKAATAAVVILVGLFLVLLFPPDKLTAVRELEADDEPDAYVLQERVKSAGTVPVEVASKPVAKKQPAKKKPEPKKKVKKEPEKPVAPPVTQTQKKEPPAKPATVTKTEAPKKAVPQPASLKEYLRDVTNPEIPVDTREKWRTKILGYFSEDALVYEQGGQTQEPFSRDEFLDIILSMDSTNTVKVDSMKENEEGKVEELHFSIEERMLNIE